MTPLHLAVRVVHVLLGALWAGGVTLLAAFVAPAVADAGPAGGAVMQALMKRGMSKALTLMGLLTVLTGIYLLWVRSGGFSGPFMGSAPGILFSVGGSFGIVALLIGVHVSRPTANKLAEIAEQVAASGAPPTPEMQAEMGRLRGRLATAIRAVAVLIGLAVVCMALGPHI